MALRRGRDGSSGRLDQLVRPTIRIRNWTWSTFRVCGYLGLALGITLAMVLAAHEGLSVWIMALVSVGAVASFFGLALLTKIVVGHEDLVYYRHEIAVVLVATGLLWLMRQPVLAYLDPTILGVGLFLACGRIGCLMVGCCHGQPHAFGVRYRAEHAAAGFPTCLIGVRLFPIQLVESLYVVAIVAAGSVLVWTGARPGVGVAAYVTAYAVGRFAFEFWRGDRERHYLAGFSEAQWSSLVLVTVVAVAERVDLLPPEGWHVAALGGLALGALLVAASRIGRKTETALFRPRHVLELAEALDWVADRPALPLGIEVRRTSLGIRVSTSTIEVERERVRHYALSSEIGLTKDTAKSLAGLIARLRHPFSSTEIIPGDRGVFHVLIHPLL
jgi:hypothetical protein